MDKRGRLQRVAGRLVGHAGRGEPAEFVVNQREDLIGGGGVAGVDPLEQLRELTHGRANR